MWRSNDLIIWTHQNNGVELRHEWDAVLNHSWYECICSMMHGKQVSVPRIQWKSGDCTSIWGSNDNDKSTSIIREKKQKIKTSFFGLSLVWQILKSFNLAYVRHKITIFIVKIAHILPGAMIFILIIVNVLASTIWSGGEYLSKTNLMCAFCTCKSIMSVGNMSV